MGKGIRKPATPHELERLSLGELIHQHVRVAIETAVHEELHAALGARPHERNAIRRGYRNGTKVRTLSGPSGPAAITVPRATLFGAKEWTSTILPRYQRRRPALNEAIAVATSCLREGGEELLTVFRFPKAQWKALRTTNVIERLHEEFRRRVKTQGSLPSEEAANRLALQPRGERADQVAQDRRLAEDCRGAQPAKRGGGVMPRALWFVASAKGGSPCCVSRRRGALPRG